jgi:hypothetical protein
VARAAEEIKMRALDLDSKLAELSQSLELG